VFGVLPKMSKKEIFVGASGMPTASALRRKVMMALGRITGDSPVQIPPGKQAAAVVYDQGRKTGRRYRIVDGTVYLIEKQDARLRDRIWHALDSIRAGMVVGIPLGEKAANYAHAHAVSTGRTYAVRYGKVMLAGDIRKKVRQALKKLTKCNPVTIPKGQLASQYAYDHARERGLRYNVIDGKVYLAENITLRAQVFQAMAFLSEENVVHIPAGKQAAQFAYAYAASTGRKCSVRNGRVTFVKGLSGTFSE